jgi:hypothetical protein
MSSRMPSSVSSVPQVVPSDRVNSDATKAELMSPSLLFTLFSLYNDEKIKMLEGGGSVLLTSLLGRMHHSIKAPLRVL